MSPAPSSNYFVDSSNKCNKLKNELNRAYSFREKQFGQRPKFGVQGKNFGLWGPRLFLSLLNLCHDNS